MPAKTLLIEIGTEELPPKSLNRLRLALGEQFAAGLAAAGLSCGEVTAFATPRRLAVLVPSLADRQPDQQVEKRGPALTAAYDSEGAPTKALLGFASSCGVEATAKFETVKTDKGEWVLFRATQAGASLTELLPDILAQALAALPIDRRMRWGKRRDEFVRPVKWLCALHGSDVLTLSLFGLTAGNSSQGHRFMSKGEFKLRQADDYVKACRKARVLVDFDERRALIADGLKETAKSVGAQVTLDPALLDEVTALTEWPVVLTGTFDDSFLALPPEVLISAMKAHQRYFHLTNAKGQLLPRFITVANIASTKPALVVSGNERVIRPRLADAAFFYDQDRRTRLADRVASLETVVFQTALGSYGDKVRRLVHLAGVIADQAGAKQGLAKAELAKDASASRRAAELAKADLTTDMVGEFPELQGLMGGYYARHDGEQAEVATAVAEHYRPTQSGGELPTSLPGCYVALADKLDTLVGLFGAGQPPSGSRDPFALRRQSLGIIRLCVEKRLALDILDCLAQAAAQYSFGQQEVVLAVHDYLLERLTNWYGDQGISADKVAAVAASKQGIRDFCQADEVVRLLAGFRDQAVAEQVIAANKRVANILRKEAANESIKGRSDPALFEADAEKQLGEALRATGAQLAAGGEDVGQKIAQLASLQPAIDQFFDDVMVMVEEPRVRANRLALLAELRELFLEVADFSLLQ